jgi:cytochrome c553
MRNVQKLWFIVVLAAAAWPAAGSESRAGDRDDIAARVQACAACHGEHGRSAEEAYAPSIAGKPGAYLFEQLRNFRDGRRQQLVMQPMLAVLTDDYLREIAAYYAGEASATRVADRGTNDRALTAGRAIVERGDTARALPACQSCHGVELLGNEPAIPGLLAVSPDYLAAQLGAWRAGVRNAKAPDCMAKIATLLTRDEIAAVTAWIASRPVPDAPKPGAEGPHDLPLRCGAVP